MSTFSRGHEPASPTVSAPDQTVNADLPAHLRVPRLLRKEASEYLAVVYGLRFTPRTLAKYATIGGGPQFQRQGRRVLYPRELLDQWASERLSAILRSTADMRGER